MKFSVKRATFVVVAVLNISELAALTPHHKRFRVSLGTNAPSIARLKPGSVNDKPRNHRRHVGPPKSILQTSGCVKGCTETRMARDDVNSETLSQACSLPFWPSIPRAST